MWVKSLIQNAYLKGIALLNAIHTAARLKIKFVRPVGHRETVASNEQLK